MNWGAWGRILLSILPALAQAVLNIQQQLGVTHPTIAGAIAEWILRGDRRQQIAEPAEPRRATDGPARELENDTPGGGA